MRMKSWKPLPGGMACIASILVVTLMYVPGESPAFASSSPVAPASTLATPAVGASIATWQAWAVAQQQSLESVNPASLVAPSPGCTNTSTKVIPVASTGAGGIPTGITTDAVVVVGSCAQNGAGAQPLSGVVPLISSYCPNMTGCNYAAATNGYVAVGTATVNGNVNYMGAAYTFTASGSGYTAHSELGTVSSGCSTGSLVANSSSASLSTNQYVEILWGPRNTSNTWTSTGWHHTSGSYQDLGTVCGMW
jgi:hypothetical protein